jgi:hypothetical protein
MPNPKEVMQKGLKKPLPKPTKNQFAEGADMKGMKPSRELIEEARRNAALDKK